MPLEILNYLCRFWSKMIQFWLEVVSILKRKKQELLEIIWIEKLGKMIGYVPNGMSINNKFQFCTPRGRNSKRIFLFISTTFIFCFVYIVIACWTFRQVNGNASTRFDEYRNTQIQKYSKWLSESNVPRELFSNTHTDVSYAYDRGWVGFPALNYVNCPHAIAKETPNKLFPQSTNRTFEQTYLHDAQNCSYFVHKYGFGRYPKPTEKELNFPIAYIILFHVDLDQMLFLLRAIYRPHNVYCLSIDTKSSVRLTETTRAVARCLPNVFLASEMEDVIYGGFSRLTADLNCMRDLVEHPVQWKYVINTPGQQFPIRTNLEIVDILQKQNGTNLMQLIDMDKFNYRFKNVYKYVTNETSGSVRIVKTDGSKNPPPSNIKIFKSSAYNGLSREFVRFVLTDTFALSLLNWSKDAYSPDEFYWASLNENTVSPVPGGPIRFRNSSLLASWSNWQMVKKQKCASHYVRDICIFTPQDLPTIVEAPTVFLNKFYIYYQPAALHCLDQRLYNNTVHHVYSDKSPRKS